MSVKATAKKSVKKAVVKKSVKKATSKKAVAVPTALQQLQKKLDASAGAKHWSEQLRDRYGWCSVPDWVKNQRSLADAWKNCERTDWMMRMLSSVMNECDRNNGYKRVLSDEARERMRFELRWMATEFGQRFKSRHDGGPSSIDATHLGHTHPYKPWTHEERMQMTDFIRFYFPTPAVQVRKYAKVKK